MSLPTETFEISNWKGLADYGPETDYDPQFIRACQNVDFDENGIIEKRRGVTRVSVTISGACNMIFDFQSQQGFSSAADNQRVLLVGASTLHVIKGFGGGSQTYDGTFAATDSLHYAAVSNNGACYLSNEKGGVPKCLAYVTNAFQYVSAALSAPAAGPIGAAGAAGSLSGTYSSVYTYEDQFGNESNRSPISNDVGLTNQSASFSVTASGDATVSLINLYVLTPSGSEYRFSRTISNTTGTFAHTVSDASVAAGDAAPSDHFTCPAAKYLMIYNDMLIAGGDPSLPDAIYPSNFQFHRQFSSDKDIARVVTGDGQPVRGFGKLYNDMMIAKADSLHLASGADNTVFKADPHNQEYGVLGQPSMSFAYQKLVFFSDDGIYLDDSLAPQEISLRLRNLMRQLNPGNLACSPPKQVSCNYKYYKKLFFSVREATGAGENDALYVWNYERDSWTRYKGIGAKVLGVIQTADDYEFLYGGDSSGNVFKFNPPNGGSPNVDNITGTPAAIDAYAETPWLHLPKLKGREGWERTKTVPLYLTLFAGGEPASGSTISLITTVYKDFGTTVQGTFTTTHNAAAWPTVTVDPKQLAIGQYVKTCDWIKFRFANSTANEHVKIHKIVFAFKIKPAVDV